MLGVMLEVLVIEFDELLPLELWEGLELDFWNYQIRGCF